MYEKYFISNEEQSIEIYKIWEQECANTKKDSSSIFYIRIIPAYMLFIFAIFIWNHRNF